MNGASRVWRLLLSVIFLRVDSNCTYGVWVAELSEVRLRTTVDMQDFFRRHGITPLVQSDNLDAGKRVLQRVRSRSNAMTPVSRHSSSYSLHYAQFVTKAGVLDVCVIR